MVYPVKKGAAMSQKAFVHSFRYSWVIREPYILIFVLIVEYSKCSIKIVHVSLFLDKDGV